MQYEEIPGLLINSKRFDWKEGSLPILSPVMLLFLSYLDHFMVIHFSTKFHIPAASECHYETGDTEYDYLW